MADEQRPASSDEEGGLTFMAFVYSLATSAAIHFGDKPDPATGRTHDVNLAGAKQMIDVLTLLDTKTRGNLTAPERQFLDDVLADLRRRFADADKPPSRISTP